MKKSGVQKLKIAIMAVHAALTFLFSKMVFHTDAANPLGTIALSDLYSDRLERIVAYIFSEFTALVIIFCLWNLVFFLIKNFKKAYIPFGVLYVAGAIVIFALWPEVFTSRFIHMHDNLATYSSAIRLWPDYWHGFYQSIVYAGCMLVLPSSFMITLVQWSYFLYGVAYLFFRARVHSKKLCYLVLLVFAIPGAFDFATYAHRVCMYVCILGIYVSVIIFDLIEKKDAGIAHYVMLGALGAFLSVWRSEGIVISSLLYLLLVIASCKKNIKKKIVRLLIFAGFFVVIYIPQKMGDIKYYGKDYSIVNTFEALSFIGNSAECNLSYEEADDDLAAVSEVVPFDLIREKQAAGYRTYNFSVRGNYDINQSGVSKENASRYLDAYKNILLHNKKLYLEFKINTVCTALGFKTPFEKGSYDGPLSELSDWHFYGWDNGYADYYTDSVMKWRQISVRERLTNKAFRIVKGYYNFFVDNGLYGTCIILLVCFNAFIAVSGIFVKKERERTGGAYIGISAVIALAFFAAVTVAMPEAWTIYYYAPCTAMIIVAFGYLIARTKNG
ncbi:MAG: hypothetical protein K5669_08760 [Lachnospiraceae bacterium]|nr:hypothetical protein [Lachnospiraceae bacterium]